MAVLKLPLEILAGRLVFCRQPGDAGNAHICTAGSVINGAFSRIFKTILPCTLDVTVAGVANNAGADGNDCTNCPDVNDTYAVPLFGPCDHADTFLSVSGCGLGAPFDGDWDLYVSVASHVCTGGGNYYVYLQASIEWFKHTNFALADSGFYYYLIDSGTIASITANDCLVYDLTGDSLVATPASGGLLTDCGPATNGNSYCDWDSGTVTIAT